MKTKKSGYWENFWYYHKVHVILGITIFFIIMISYKMRPEKMNYDYSIGLITEKRYSDELKDSIRITMEKYGKDRNQDGNVNVNLVEYVFSNKAEDRKTSEADFVRLTGDLTEENSILFFTTEDMEMQFREQQIFDESTKLAVGDCKAYQSNENIEVLKSEHCCLVLQNTEKDTNYSEDCKALLNSLQEGNP